MSRAAIHWSQRSDWCYWSRGNGSHGTHWFYRPIGRADRGNWSHRPRFNGCYRIIWNQRNYWCYRFARSYGKHRIDWSARRNGTTRFYGYWVNWCYRSYWSARPNRARGINWNGRPSRSYGIDWADWSKRVGSYRLNRN